MLNKTLQITKYNVKGFKNIVENYNIVNIQNICNSNFTDNKIKSIDNEPLEMTYGWADFEDNYGTQFNNIIADINTYSVIKASMRIDIKKIDKHILKAKVYERIQSAKLANISNVEDDSFYDSKEYRQEIIDEVYDTMLIYTKATPKAIPVIIFPDTETLWFGSTSAKFNEYFVDLFNKTFECMPIPEIPYQKTNRPKDIDVADQYNNYAQIGYDFCKYMYYASITSNVDINFELGNKIVLANITEDKIQEKFTITGSEYDTFTTNKIIADGAEIIEIGLIFNYPEYSIPIYIKAKDMNYSGVKTLKQEDDEAGFIIKIETISELLDDIDKYFNDFLKQYENWEEINNKIIADLSGSPF